MEKMKIIYRTVFLHNRYGMRWHFRTNKTRSPEQTLNAPFVVVVRREVDNYSEHESLLYTDAPDNNTPCSESIAEIA